MIRGLWDFIKYMFIYLLFSPIIAILMIWFTFPVALIVMYFFDMELKKSLEIATVIAILYNGVDLYRDTQNKEGVVGEKLGDKI